MTDKPMVPPKVMEAIYAGFKSFHEGTPSVLQSIMSSACGGFVKCPHCEKPVPITGDPRAQKLFMDIHYKEREAWREKFGEAMPGDWATLTQDRSAEEVRELRDFVAKWQKRTSRQRSRPQESDAESDDEPRPESPDEPSPR